MSYLPDNFHFLVLNKKSDWEKGLLVSLDATDQGIGLIESFDYTVESTITGGVLPTELDLQDFDLGPGDIIYLLDASMHSIYIYYISQESFEQINCSDGCFVNPTSIASTSEMLYVADLEAEHRIYALAYGNWQIKWTIDSELKPRDIATDLDSNLYVLDENNLTVVKFDKYGNFVKHFGHDLLSSGDPVALAVSQDSFIYVVDRSNKVVFKFTCEGEPILEFPVDIDPISLGIDNEGFLYVGDGRPINPYDEDDRFIRIFTPTGQFLGEVSGFRGSTGNIHFDCANRMYIFDRDKKAIVVLKRESIFSKSKGTQLPTGFFISMSFDSVKNGTQWHKFLLDLDLPQNTLIKVSYLIADKNNFFLNGEEKNLDDFILDKSMEPTEKLGVLNTLAWSKQLVNPRDALVRSPVGRYLWLRVEVIGSRKASPFIKSIRVYFPRQSYLRYLPAIYQKDETSRDFLERFLSLFETFFLGTEEQIDHISRFFDADVVAGDFLRWLASWLAVTADQNWSEEKLRLLVKRAPEIYKKRGTRQAIEEMIEIFTGERPIIVEQFQLQCAITSEIRALFDNLFGTDPYCFCVLLRPFQVKEENERLTVKRIVDLEKPAHTCGGVKLLSPKIFLDMHSYLEINSYLSESASRLDMGAGLSRDTFLTDSKYFGKLEK